METRYSAAEAQEDLESLHVVPTTDKSGLRLYYTSNLRKYDAGVLSIGKLPLFDPIIIILMRQN